MNLYELNETLTTAANRLGVAHLERANERLEKTPGLFNFSRAGYECVAADYSRAIDSLAGRMRDTAKDVRRCADTLQANPGGRNVYQTERAADMALDAALNAATEALYLAGYAWALRAASREAAERK